MLNRCNRRVGFDEQDGNVSHYRKPIALAVALNATLCVGEAIGGVYGNSLSLIMDAIHNLSDELALVFLLLALAIPRSPSRHLVRCANLANLIGLLAVGSVIAWQAVGRIGNPASVIAAFPVAFGLGAALGNWGVARLLREPARQSAAIRLSYVHNLGDVYVSLVPVAAGILVALTGLPVLDTLVALAIAIWFIWATAKEIVRSRRELLWPEGLSCDHPARGTAS